VRRPVTRLRAEKTSSSATVWGAQLSPFSQPQSSPPLQRVQWLCDPHSVVPLDPDPPARGASVAVHAAWGRVGGRRVVCYAQDSSVSGGSVGVAEAEVIVRALRHSRGAGVPLVGFLESAGARLQEGAAALDGFGRIFYENVALSGRSPQISVITGTAAGGGCYSPALTDFVVMTERSSMFLTGPRIVRHALGEEVSADALGGARVHARNGVCDFVTADDRSAIGLLRELLGYLPQNARAAAPVRPPQDPAPGEPGAVLPPASRNWYDVRDLIARIADAGRFQEVAALRARNIVVGFARLQGHTIGIVANQPRHRGGIIDVQASQKAARFIRTCDAFALPMLVLVDTPGFLPGSREEAAGVIGHGADLVRAFAAARTRRVTVIVRKAFGGAFITMNSKGLGADASFCWPTAEIGIMSAQAAVEIIHGRMLADGGGADRRERLASDYEEHLSPAAAVGCGAVDAVIDPSSTRTRVAAALALDAAPGRGLLSALARTPEPSHARPPARLGQRLAPSPTYRPTTTPEGAQP
jgi:acetyl-CoA carboxylase carboxyltransferase component